MKSKEEYFIELLKVLKPETINEYPDYIFYVYKDKIYIEYNKKNNYAWLDYNRIWSIFLSKYNCSHQKIKKITTDLVEEHLKLKGVTTNYLIIL